jgi:hypothetical protein
METDLPLEVIGNYKVHPAASFFPLIEGEEFDALVMSIKTVGLMNPIVLKDGMLIDGRNRLRAILELQSKHSSIKILTKELELDVKSISEYIFHTNIQRRHLTPDQMASIGYEILPMIAQEREAKQAATQFKPGVSGNPTGKVKEQVDVKSYPPATTGESTVNTKPCSPSPRDVKQKNEQSTIGQIANFTKVSHHTARQLVAVSKAIEAGELPKGTISKVRSGAVKLKDVAPKPKKKELTRDMKLELAVGHVYQGMDEYMSVENASVRLLELASNAKIDLLKKELRK